MKYSQCVYYQGSVELIIMTLANLPNLSHTIITLLLIEIVPYFE